MKNTELNIGDKAIIYGYEHETSKLNVTITDVKKPAKGCQSGVLYQCTPMPRGSDKNSWFDAAWFTPVNKTSS